MAELVWVCDYCCHLEEDKVSIDGHEENCDENPANMIIDEDEYYDDDDDVEDGL